MWNAVAVGAGWVTNARHIPALKQSRRCRVLGMVDRHRDRAEAAARKHRLPHASHLLDAPWTHDAHLFTVGVSPMAHFEVVHQLLDRGKHVLMEKPMCLTVADGETLVKKAHEGNLVLALVHNFQFAKSVQTAQDWIASGRWGKVIALHGFQWSNPRRRLPHWYEQLPLGLFYDESPHLLYLLRAFGGTVTVHDAHMVRSTLGKSTPSQLHVQLDSAGIPATLFMNFEAPLSEWHLMVLLEGGAIIVDVFRDIPIFVRNDNLHEAGDILRSSRSLIWGHLAGFIRSGIRLLRQRLYYGNDVVVQRFLDAIEGIAPLRDIDAATGLEILRLQHDIIRRCGALP